MATWPNFSGFPALATPISGKKGGPQCFTGLADLSLPVVVPCSTGDGPRLVEPYYLTPTERNAAPGPLLVLLAGANAPVEERPRNAADVRAVNWTWPAEKLFQLDDAEVAAPLSLAVPPVISGEIRLLVAGRIGKVCLIDNVAASVGEGSQPGPPHPSMLEQQIVVGLFDDNGSVGMGELVHQLRVAVTPLTRPSPYNWLSDSPSISSQFHGHLCGDRLCGAPCSRRRCAVMFSRRLKVPSVFVEPGVRTGRPVLVDNPKEVGADRIADAVAAFERYGGPTIVVTSARRPTSRSCPAKGRVRGWGPFPGGGAFV